MSETPQEHPAWADPGPDPKRIVEDMRRAIERAREQVRSYRRAIERDRSEP